jgi:hypothetical protein
MSKAMLAERANTLNRRKKKNEMNKTQIYGINDYGHLGTIEI